jgi:hypothetical protein
MMSSISTKCSTSKITRLPARSISAGVSAKNGHSWGQYWATDNSGEAVLTEDVEWEDVVFKEGTFAAGGVELDVVRAFFGREFNLGPERGLAGQP